MIQLLPKLALRLLLRPGVGRFHLTLFALLRLELVPRWPFLSGENRLNFVFFSERSACLLAIETHQLFIFGALSATWRLRLAQAQMLSVNERGASAAAQEPIDEETAGKCRLFSRGAPHGGRDTGPIIRAFAFTRESKYSFSNCLLWKGLASKSSSVRAGGGGARTGLFVFFPIASPTRACVAPSSSAPSRRWEIPEAYMFKRRYVL